MKLHDIKGIGPKTEELLRNKGINDFASLIYTIPSSYTEYRLTPFSFDGNFNVEATVIDNVKLLKLKTATRVSFEALINGLTFNVVLFNQVYLKSALEIGSDIVIVGSYDSSFKAVLASRVFLKKDYKEGIVPEYNIDGITNPHFQKIILEALNYYDERNIVIPESYFSKYGFVSGKSLILAINSPKTMEEAAKAKEALKYYELLSFSIKMSLIRKSIEQEKKDPKHPDLSKVKDFISLSIPFELTADQKKAVNDIFSAFKSPSPLSMLLEGDVGSGKTIVAIISAYAVYTSGYQSLVMVPTEALANQHYQTFRNYLEKWDVKIALLTSSTSFKDRQEILNGLKDGSIDLVIGTHSLLSDEVIFKKLGFIVCDEQHKFGVDQRKKVREKGEHPDVLYMTATPIPRTLSLTLYGDMALESIHTLPSSRKKIITKIHTYKDYLKVLNFVKSEVDDGRQAYFVSPIIENDPDGTLTSVVKVQSDLAAYFKDKKIGLLHGKLKEEEKASVISSFMKGEIPILASTSVIEVGIDNPNASVMVVIDANQFGLAELHQLRGRVGRGSYEGYCFLMVNKMELGDKLQVLEESQDGFYISEEDLRQRGPGDFLGTDQSGIIRFRFADIFDDQKLLEAAMKDANELISTSKEVVSFYENHLYSDNFD